MASYDRLIRRGRANAANFTHAGVSFRHMDVTGVISNGATFDILLQTPAADTIVLLQQAVLTIAGAPFDVEIREGATFSNAGTALNVVSTNRRSANTPTVTATKNPTLTGTGTKLLLWKHLPNGVPPVSPIGGDSNELSDPDIVLDSNTTYLIRLSNNTGSNAGGDVSLLWSELKE